MTRHLLDRSSFVRTALAVLLGIAGTAYGSVPAMDITVFNADGRVAFRGPMTSNATFATHDLPPGNYTVQFNTKSAAAKNNQFLVVVSAASKKVIASSVPGEKFMGGGVAMKIQVGPNAKVTGQVANDQATASGGAVTRMIDGKRYFLVSSAMGTNLGPHWVEETTPLAQNIHIWTREELQKRIDRGGEGSMITNTDHFPNKKGF